jgi:hypothetical protein
MTDFSIRVKGIPHHKFYSDVDGDDDGILKAILLKHFEQVVKDQIQEE